MRFARILALAATLFSATAWSGECTNWQQLHPEWLWCDDFETVTSLAGSYEDYNLAGLAVTTGTGFNGSKGLTQSYAAGQADGGWIVKYKSAGFPDHVFYRIYHKFDQGFTTFPPKISRIGYRSHSTWQEIFRVHTWAIESTGELTADVMAKNSTQANSTSWLPVAKSGYSFKDHIGQWVPIEVELKLNTPGAKDGLYRVWIDNKLVIERLNVDIRGSTSDKINEVMLDTYWNGGASSTLKRHYDNFVISTSKIGPSGATTLAPPNPPTNVEVITE